MRCQEFNSASIARIYNALNLIINRLGGRLTIIGRSNAIIHAHKGTGTLAKGDGAESFAHTPSNHHLAGNSRYPLQVILGTRSNVPDSHLFRSPPAKSSNNPPHKILFREVMAILKWR